MKNEKEMKFSWLHILKTFLGQCLGQGGLGNALCWELAPASHAAFPLLDQALSWKESTHHKLPHGGWHPPMFVQVKAGLWSAAPRTCMPRNHLGSCDNANSNMSPGGANAACQPMGHTLIGKAWHHTLKTDSTFLKVTFLKKKHAHNVRWHEGR